MTGPTGSGTATATANAGGVGGATGGSGGNGGIGSIGGTGGTGGATGGGGFTAGVPVGSSGCVLSVQVQLDKSSAGGPPSYPAGQNPTFSVILKNLGTGNCLFDVSGRGVVVMVTPVGSTSAVWTTATCAGNKDMRVLGPGDGYTEPVKWDREKSVSSCPSAPPVVDPGAYAVTAAASGVNAASVQFTLQ